MTVVDASVVLKWLLAEPSEETKQLLKAHLSGSDPFVAPELLYCEIGNVLVTKTKLSAQETEISLDILSICKSKPIAWDPTNTKWRSI